jgi:hypothetical protein
VIKENVFMKKSPSLVLLVFLCAGSGLAACSADDEIDNEIDCQAICQRYADCFDDTYDVSACQDRCETDTDQGELTFEEVDACDDCIDDRSCASGTLNCVNECSGIVP